MIEEIKIENFKSIKQLELELKPINILIGPNGVGKSNFISFFEFLRKIYEQNLQSYVAGKGGANNLLYFGRKKSNFLSGYINFASRNDYSFTLEPDNQNSFYFSTEKDRFNKNYEFPAEKPKWHEELLETPARESSLKTMKTRRSDYLKNCLNSFKVFHFHDTSSSSLIKQTCNTNDTQSLREDGSNLAAFLYFLQKCYPMNFTLIEKTIRSVAPFFGSFDLKPTAGNKNFIQLEWKEQGSDFYFNAHNLSDGTLRMMCLVTLFLQPDLPKTIIIDEPELGLHPFAINKLAGLVKSASSKSQVIVSTQAVNFMDNFEPENIVVADRKDKQSVFKRLDKDELKDRLKDYSIGELWEKNVIGGRP